MGLANRLVEPGVRSSTRSSSPTHRRLPAALHAQRPALGYEAVGLSLPDALGARPSSPRRGALGETLAGARALRGAAGMASSSSSTRAPRASAWCGGRIRRGLLACAAFRGRGVRVGACFVACDAFAARGGRDRADFFARGVWLGRGRASLPPVAAAAGTTVNRGARHRGGRRPGMAARLAVGRDDRGGACPAVSSRW